MTTLGARRILAGAAAAGGRAAIGPVFASAAAAEAECEDLPPGRAAR